MEKTPLVSGGEDAISLLVETKALCYGAAKNNVTLNKKKKNPLDTLAPVNLFSLYVLQLVPSVYGSRQKNVSVSANMNVNFWT